MHPESLLRVPLVRHLFQDKTVTLEARGVDNRWRYQGVTALSVTGFNPFVGKVFYAAVSPFARWLSQKEGSARALNEGDVLMKEVLFAVHDYLHVWSLFVINELHPQLGLGVAPITKRNVEDLVFCHLLTEAAAVVGLDYWYLSTVDLDREVPIGTVTTSLAIGYHERYASEYRRFNPTFAVQDPGFFATIANFYCDGVFPGFDVADLKQSPRILTWLRHELVYGQKQREYIRLWLSFLSGGRVQYAPSELTSVVRAKAPWQRRLIRELGARLWDKVKSDRVNGEGRPIVTGDAWKSPKGQRPDFRFVNANAVDPSGLAEIAKWENAQTNTSLYLNQYISRFDYSAFDPTLKRLLPTLLERKDVALIHDLFRGQKQLEPRSEVLDLMIVN
jgi:hypothetical protein